MGRSGGMVHVGFSRPWTKDRTAEQQANDVAIYGWDRGLTEAEANKELKRIADLKAKSTYIIGFGPKAHPQMTSLVEACDVFVDSGYSEIDHAIALADGSTTGKMNHIVNALAGWVFTAELVAALTREGHMPTMWMSYALPEGREWGDRYLGKKKFHDDFDIAPIEAGVLSREYLDAIRKLIRRFRDTALDEVADAADLIVADRLADLPVVSATSGHMPWVYVGKYRDGEWITPIDLHHTVDYQVKTYNEKAPVGSLVVRLGYYGLHRDAMDIFRAKEQRVILITADRPGDEWQPPDDVLVTIDMGYAFGDAEVAIDGYPIKLFPPSGVMQVVAWESLSAAVLERLAEARDAEQPKE